MKDSPFGGCVADCLHFSSWFEGESRREKSLSYITKCDPPNPNHIRAKTCEKHPLMAQTWVLVAQRTVAHSQQPC